MGGQPHERGVGVRPPGGDLKKSLPILESNARFIMSWFEEDDQGHYLSGPGVSPETGFYAPDGTGPNVLSYVSNGTSHDQLLGRESLRNYIYACGELGIRTPTLVKAVQFLKKIPQPAIGSDGRVLEWRQPFEEMQKGHRHISHLYGLFPGTEWDVLNTPEYAAAASTRTRGTTASGPAGAPHGSSTFMPPLATETPRRTGCTPC